MIFDQSSKRLALCNTFEKWIASSYSISQEICTRFCCALLCCGYAIVHNEFIWSIYPYSSGLLCWHGDNRQWSKPDGYVKISQCITTTKHSKVKTVCMFFGYTVCGPFLVYSISNYHNRFKHVFHQVLGNVRPMQRILPAKVILGIWLFKTKTWFKSI